MGLIFSTPRVLRNTAAFLQLVMVFAFSAESRPTMTCSDGRTAIQQGVGDRSSSESSDRPREGRGGRPPGRLEAAVASPAFVASWSASRPASSSSSSSGAGKFLENNMQRHVEKTSAMAAVQPRMMAGPMKSGVLGAVARSAASGLSKVTTKMTSSGESSVHLEGQEARRFFLLRHGQTNFNAEGRVQGSSDFSRLTELGVQQAKGAGDFLSQYQFGQVYVSPLARAQQTLETARGQGIEEMPGVTVDEGLREIDLYEWQGMLKQDIKEEYPEQYDLWRGAGASQLKLPSGNMPVVQLWDRAHEVWGRLLEAPANRRPASGGSDEGDALLPDLVVAHNAIIQAMLCSAMGLGEDAFRRFQVPNCGVVEVEWVPGEKYARRWRWMYPTEDERGWRTPEEEVAAFEESTAAKQREQGDSERGKKLMTLTRQDSDSM